MKKLIILIIIILKFSVEMLSQDTILISGMWMQNGRDTIEFEVVKVEDKYILSSEISGKPLILIEEKPSIFKIERNNTLIGYLRKEKNIFIFKD